ncbi:MAG: hypothetical protein K8M05_40585, partial [Deltaproteobacteria bacterium]|nr:hypothetical protein [Kofleriaceae bacterium]
MRADERVVVSSFDPAALWQLHAVAPHLPLAYLFEARLPRALRSAAAAMLVGASAVHPEHVLCTPAQVAAWRARGLAVNAWTVDDPARLRALAAFALSRAHGADGVELDVLLCASGEVVVFHDDDLRRLAGRPERVDAVPWSELSRVELLGGGGQRIPRLEEALEACGDLRVNVEIKSPRA